MKLDNWNKKFSRNIEKDLDVTANWIIKRIWEHEIKHDFDKAVEDTMKFINEVKASYIAR